jgi:outer membrane protein OmpA-like peptidoglycan-associated protein
MRIHRYTPLVLAAGLAAACWAQEPNPTEKPSSPPPQQQSPAQLANDQVPLYKIQVVQREIPAINYINRKGRTTIGLRGTSLMPDAKGFARVAENDGNSSIDVDLEGLTPANGFGAEYLTYVLWAITPEGRPSNLGEVLPTGKKNQVKMAVTTNLQSFGLVITAEPYFAVTEPSDLVVMQNFVDKHTQGFVEQVNAHYLLLPRGAYTETAGRHQVLHPIGRNGHQPLELYEAENAIQIAQAAGAHHYASDTFATAQTALQNAQSEDTSHHDRKMTVTYAREAVQSAEDARIITIRAIKAEDEANAARAREQAEQEAARQKQAAAEAAAQRAQAEQQAQEAAAQRAQAEAAAQEAQARAQQAAAARAAAEAQAALAQKQAQSAAQQEAQMRERLRQQLSQVLQTRETARGLIVNMPNVLFAFNKYDLKPEAKVKLAKVSGILQAYPDLKIQVEGYTDSIGSDEYNQKLSEERADQVRDFLVAQDVQPNNVTAEGYGKLDPIADNSTAEGRQQNRRVQLVVSGSSIGVGQSQPGVMGDSQPTGAPGQPQPGAATPAHQ